MMTDDNVRSDLFSFVSHTDSRNKGAHFSGYAAGNVACYINSYCDKIMKLSGQSFVLSYNLGKVTENTGISIEITDFKIKRYIGTVFMHRYGPSVGCLSSNFYPTIILN